MSVWSKICYNYGVFIGDILTMTLDKARIDKSWLKARAEDIQKVDYIDPTLYRKYNVKRGLRNEDGTGVLVGLTTIGNVHGYVVSEGEKQAIPVNFSIAASM